MFGRCFDILDMRFFMIGQGDDLRLQHSVQFGMSKFCIQHCVLELSALGVTASFLRVIRESTFRLVVLRLWVETSAFVCMRMVIGLML